MLPKVKRTAARKYKPLLFTTTVRNPVRIKGYLYVLNKFVGRTLTDALAVEICGEAMRYGLYRPYKITPSIKSKWGNTKGNEFGEVCLSDSEVNFLIKNNPQKHKEAGFQVGWPSRFQTIYGIFNRLGLAYIIPGKKIAVSSVGKRFLENMTVDVDAQKNITVTEGNPKNDTDAFLHAMVKYHRDNPFERVLNTNTPLILLLKVIRLLNADKKNNGKGLSRKEVPILIFWKNDDAQAAYEMIMEIRKKYGYNPSDEVIKDYCVGKILNGDFKKFKLASIVGEYPDDYIRKMRFTGLISLRGAGRFIDINSLEEEKVDYILKTYSTYKSFESADEYYEYVSTVDDALLGIPAKKIDESKGEELLSNWLKVYQWEDVKSELKILEMHSESHDPVLKFLNAPVRLEFLSALAVKLRRSKYRVKPNYSCDDEGLPTSTAGGNQGDIECYGENNFLVEVTMSQGRDQTVKEGWPVVRHLEEFAVSSGADPTGVFVAPSVYIDTKRQFEFAFEKQHTPYAISYTISEFVSELEKTDETFAIAP